MANDKLNYDDYRKMTDADLIEMHKEIVIVIQERKAKEEAQLRLDFDRPATPKHHNRTLNS